MAALANGRKFRTVNLKDDCTRECPAIDVALSYLKAPRHCPIAHAAE